MRFLLALTLVSLIPNASAESAAEFATARRRIIEEARLDAFVREYGTQVKRPADLPRIFGYGAKHKFQREWTKLTKSVTELPTITRRGLVLTLKYAAGDLTIDVTNVSRNQVVIDGVPWTVDPTAPPALQAELLQAKLRAATRAARHQPTPWWTVVLPTADAGMPNLVKPALKPSVYESISQRLCKGNCTGIGIIVTAMSIGLGNIQDIVTKGSCYFYYSADIKVPFKAGFCLPWREQHLATEKIEREQSIANWGALKGKVRWISDPNPKCMNKDPNGVESYAFNMTEVAQNQSERQKVYFSGKGKNGLLSDAAVYKNAEDAGAPDAASRALAQFIFTEDPKQTAAGVPPALSYVRVLDDEMPSSADSDRHRMVDLSKRPKEVPISVTDKVFRYVAMIGNAQKWLIACQEISESAKLNPGLAETTVNTIITNEKEKKAVQPEDAAAITR